jgi:FkbM family methyltransferase
MFLDIVVRILKPSHFFEIGAYEAGTSIRIAKQLSQTVCVAFEADQDVYSHFLSVHAPASPPNFRYLHRAICDYDGVMNFQKQTAIDGQEADILAKNNSAKQKDIQATYRSIETKCQRIDTFVAELSERPTSCILRLDVEGICYEALMGAGDVLDTCVAVYAEVEDFVIWRDQKTAFAVHELLYRRGFVPVSRDVETVGQYNVLWLKQGLTNFRPIRSRLAIYFSELQHIVAQSSSRDRSSALPVNSHDSSV